MSRKGIGVGIFLILAGLLTILMQMGIFSWSILMVFANNVELTISLILIVVGINIVLKKYPFVKVLTWLAFFAVMIVYGYYTEGNIEKDNNNINQTFEIEKVNQTNNGELTLEVSALNFILGSTEAHLIDGIVKNTGIEYSVNYKNDSKTADIKVETNDKRFFQNFFKSLLSTGEISIDRKCNLNINSDVIWKLNMKLDAVDSDIDLTDLKVKQLDIDGNAGSFELTLGEREKDTIVEIDADASEIKIFVPIQSGIRVKVDGAVNSTDFKDIDMDKDGSYYLSKNYNDADNKIELNVDINAGKLKIIGIKE